MKRSLTLTDLRPTAGHARSGFTLIELMIAITIIAMLAGLLLVALGGANTAAKVAQTSQEIRGLESAINVFESTYGPLPSTLILHEDPTKWSPAPGATTDVVTGFGGPITYGHADSGLTTLSRDALIRMFPLWSPTAPASAFDWNSDGDTDDSFILNGSECLVFFLGGHMTASSGGLPVPVGLNFKSPNPFVPPASASSPGLTIHYKEFVSSRLVDVDSDGFLEFRDAVGSDGSPPYQYFRAGPLGYRQSPLGTSVGTLAGADGEYGTVDDETLSLPGSPATPVGPIFPYLRAPTIPWQKDSFQIISAGYDGKFGQGGEWEEESGTAGGSFPSPDNFPDLAQPAVLVAPGTAQGRQTNFEADNITNFSGGTLN